MASHMDYILVKHAEAFARLRSKIFSSVDYIRVKSAEISAWLKDKICSFWDCLCEKIRDARDKGKHYYEDFSKNVEDILAKTKSNIDGIVEKMTRTMSSWGCFNLMSEKRTMLWIEALDSVVRDARNIVVEIRRMGRGIRKSHKGTKVLDITLDKAEFFVTSIDIILDTAEFFLTSIAKFISTMKKLRVLLIDWSQLGLGSPLARAALILKFIRTVQASSLIS